MAATTTLRSAQLQCLHTLLNLNTPVAPPKAGTSQNQEADLTLPTGPPVWKVLILDKTSQEILATSMRVQDLRDAGVTVHM